MGACEDRHLGGSRSGLVVLMEEEELALEDMPWEKNVVVEERLLVELPEKLLCSSSEV